MKAKTKIAKDFQRIDPRLEVSRFISEEK